MSSKIYELHLSEQNNLRVGIVRLLNSFLFTTMCFLSSNQGSGIQAEKRVASILMKNNLELITVSGL